MANDNKHLMVLSLILRIMLLCHFLSYQARSQCARELHGTRGREQMQQISVITEPENGIDKDSERRGIPVQPKVSHDGDPTKSTS